MTSFAAAIIWLAARAAGCRPRCGDGESDPGSQRELRQRHPRLRVRRIQRLRRRGPPAPANHLNPTFRYMEPSDWASCVPSQHSQLPVNLGKHWLVAATRATIPNLCVWNLDYPSDNVVVNSH